MKKETFKKILRRAAIVMAVLILVGTTFEISNRVLAQTTGYRFGPNGLIFQGQTGALCFEQTFLSGVDSCINRLTTGSLGVTPGGVNIGYAQLAPTPASANSASTTGGFLATGTYISAATYVTITGGETTIAAAQESTGTSVTGPTGDLTITAPIAAAGAAGWKPYLTTGATLTELSQTVNTTVCAGAFQVNGPAGPATGPWVCPFGTNALITVLATAPTIYTPNIPGSGPTYQNGGIGIPAQNTASYPAGIPQTICNFMATTALTTSTTATTAATCPLAAGIQNGYGKVLHVTGHGVYTATGTPTFAVGLKEGGQVPLIVTSAAVTTGGQTNAQFSFDYYLTTGLTGTAGKVEPHGTLLIQGASASNGTAMLAYNDQNTGLNATGFDLTAANTLLIQITGSTGVSATTVRDAQVTVMN